MTEIKADQGLYKELQNTMHHIDISFSNIMGLVLELTKAAEQKKDIPGVEKKFVVIQALRMYVLHDSIDNDQQKALLLFIDHTLPHLIDLMITLDKSEFVIKMKKRVLFCIPK